VSGLGSPVAAAALRSERREIAATVVAVVENRVILDCDVPVELVADDALEEFALHLLGEDGRDLVPSAAIEIAGPDFNGE
jgi:hypothetical protein